MIINPLSYKYNTSTADWAISSAPPYYIISLYYYSYVEIDCQFWALPVN